MTMITLLALTLSSSILFSLFDSGDSQCIQTYDNGYYIGVRDICGGSYTWQEAEDYCTSELNSHLATILNSVYNQYAYFARNGLSPIGVSEPIGWLEDAWIGGTDQLTEGIWVWTEGHEDWDYDNWFASEPNNYLGNQDCAIMGARSDKWDDINCESQRDTWICNSLQTATCEVEDIIGVYAPLGSFNFEEAQTFCEDNYDNGRLVSIADATEQGYTLDARECIDSLPASRWCWIGLEADSGNLAWLDGTEYDYENFASNPNTQNGDCVLMLPGGTWDYFDCDQAVINCFLCESGALDDGSEPTPRPTDNPTDRPTPRPTASPNSQPSEPSTQPGYWWQQWWSG